MKPSSPRRILQSGLILASTALLVSACAHVKQDEFEAEIEQVRQEIRDGDAAVEARLGTRIDEVDARLNALESDLMALRDEFEVTVERMETALRFNTPVHFDFDDDRVRNQDRPVLERFAAVVSEHYRGATITVEGFTDPSGPAEYNLRLGQRRADNVRSFLQAEGLSSDQLRAVSYGEASDRQIVPGAAGPGSEGWQNRRVALVIDFGPDSGERPVASRPDSSR
ncbi:MAG: OmpA family protein [Gemmatimonadales bacterium]|nr:MAG: OmpA family protein [Gemmatimonadales bacterium]